MYVKNPRLVNIFFCPETTARANTAYDTALYNAATMYVAQQNKTTGGGGWVLIVYLNLLQKRF